MNKWRAANKTQAVLMCAPALGPDELVPSWTPDVDEEFNSNFLNSTKPFLQNYNVTNLCKLICTCVTGNHW